MASGRVAMEGLSKKQAFVMLSKGWEGGRQAQLHQELVPEG